MLLPKKTIFTLILMTAPALSMASLQPITCPEIGDANKSGIAQAHKEIDESEHYKKVENEAASAQDCMLDLSEFMGGSVGHGQLGGVIDALKDQLNSAACDGAKRAAQAARDKVAHIEGQIEGGLGAVGGSVGDYIDSISTGEFAQSPDAALRDWAAAEVKKEAEKKARELQAELERRGYVKQQNPADRLNDMFDMISRVYQF